MAETLRGPDGVLRALIQASPLAIVAVDCDAKVTVWNPAAQRIFGWSEADVLGRRSLLARERAGGASPGDSA